MFLRYSGKLSKGYKPFYLEFSEFKRKADTFSNEELELKVMEEIKKLENLIPNNLRENKI